MDWTPWQVVALIAVVAATGLGLAVLFVWYKLTSRQRELAELGPEGRAGRLLGELVGQCGGDLNVETVDELLAILARATSEQKTAVVSAISGLFAMASDGPSNLPNLNNIVLAFARRLGTSGAGSVPEMEDSQPAG